MVSHAVVEQTKEDNIARLPVFSQRETLPVPAKPYDQIWTPAVVDVSVSATGIETRVGAQVFVQQVLQIQTGLKVGVVDDFGTGTPPFGRWPAAIISRIVDVAQATPCSSQELFLASTERLSVRVVEQDKTA